MSWYHVWDNLKNKTCRYLLQRYLGQFLEGQLNLEQLKIELKNGKATIRNVSLKVDSINELFESQGWAFEVINGHIGMLTVTVPWNALMTNGSSIDVTDLFISLRPVKRENDGTSMLESMWSSASSSLQLAEECMNQNLEETEELSELPSIAGLEKFAETIDSVLNKITAKFTNTIIKLEYPAQNSSQMISLVMKMENFCYKNETGEHKPSTNIGESNAFPSDYSQEERIHLKPTFAKHTIEMHGIVVETLECKVDKRSSSSSSMQCVCSNYCSELQAARCVCSGIPCLEIKGNQRISIRVKASEEISGPKITVDCEISTLYAFVTPRQLHLIIKIADAFSEDEVYPDLSGSKNNNERYPQRKYQMAGVLDFEGNWGGGHMEENNRRMGDNYGNISLKSDRKYCESLSSSASSNSTTTIGNSTRFQRKIANLESCGEILKFEIRIGSIAAIILHEDILFESSIEMEHSILNEKSYYNLFRLSSEFFNSITSSTNFCDLTQLTASVFGTKSHFCLLMTPVFLSGIQQRNKNVLLLKLSMSATEVDLLESVDGVQVPLLLFDRTENYSAGYHRRPEVTVSLKSAHACNTKEVNSTVLDITLQKCEIELDISIYDRLSALFSTSPFECMNPDFRRGGNHCSSSSDFSTEIIVCAGSVDAKLRFPIGDLRPVHDENRVPWWKRNIRTDFLLLALTQVRFHFNSSRCELTSNQIDIYYCENLDSKIHIFRASMEGSDEVSLNNPKIEYPKISVIFPSKSKEMSNHKYKDFNQGPPVLPFSARRVCRQSDTIHNKRDVAESETIILPGDCNELKTFYKTTINRSKLVLNLILPMVDILLESKQLYEIIYNRLNSDLFLWEPSSPLLKQSDRNPSPRMDRNLYNSSFTDSIYIPSSNLPEDPYDILDNTFSKCKMKNDDSEEEKPFMSDLNASIYFSAHEKDHFKSADAAPGNRKQNECSVDIKIRKGRLSFFSPVRDEENHVIPGQTGKFSANIEDATIFFVAGFNGSSDLGYMCIELKKAELYHCGLTPTMCPKVLEDLEDGVPEYMKSTFYKIPINLTKGNTQKEDSRDAISVVMEIKKLKEQRIKRLRVTTGLQRIALRHHFLPAQYTWLNQIIDFLDVQDYPIEGYQSYGIITEMQLHLWDCAIDYRPKNLSYRAVVEIGSLTISSNVISAMVGCNLRFIVEDFLLAIAPYDNMGSNHPDNVISVIPAKNLVPVLDIGLVDISLRLSDAKSDKSPKFDLRCSIHDAHLRTCADSGCALAQLIAYLANDGDFQQNKDDDEGSSIQSSIYSDVGILSESSSNERKEVTSKQQERVNILMAEAVQETVTSETTVKEKPTVSGKKGVELFYFPDESNKITSKSKVEIQSKNKRNDRSDVIDYETNILTGSCSSSTTECEEALPQIKADLGDITKSLKLSPPPFQDDDYCVIGNDEQILKMNYGFEDVRIPNEPLRIVDNHFCLPDGKQDLLKAPDNFPIAELRYTLCEMTFTWHLYGGKDFSETHSTNNENTSNRSKTKMSETYKHGVSYAKSAQSVQFIGKPKEKVTWKTIGGEQRNHNVLVQMQFTKLRFSHEVYPSDALQASRQVLLINEVEIRDRLQSSDINKFLYHPNQKTLSNQSPQQMVIIKAIHMRSAPLPTAPQECSLWVSLLPIRLHIDQNTLIFLADYFTSLGESNFDYSENSDSESNKSSTSLQEHNPVMCVADDEPEAVQDLRARKLVTENIDLLMDTTKNSDDQTTKETTKQATTAATTTATTTTVNSEENSPTYFREIVFSPEVPICLDYHGRKIELSRGPIAGLLMGLGQLQCSEIRLRKIVYKRGILGVDKLITYLCKEWLRDIKRNQLPKILSGVGPTHAFVQLFQGIYDLFWLPIDQYQKDGRIIRGLQLGAQSFTARTALAALEITSRIIHILQFTAETAFDMVSPGPSVKRSRKLRKGKGKKRPHRPKDIREGVTNAYLIVKEGINDSANDLIETAVAEHDQKGYTGAVGAVVRQIPQLMVCPAVLATQATSNILGGVKNSLIPEAKIEARDKWKDDSD